MGDWEQLLKELAESDIRHGGFFREALLEINSLRQRVKELEEGYVVSEIQYFSDVDTATEIGSLRNKLAAMTEERDVLKLREALNAEPEKMRAEIERLHRQVEQLLTTNSGELAASQHYAQQLREALEFMELLVEIYDGKALDIQRIKEKRNTALSLSHDTTALDQLKAGYELQIKTLRDALGENMRLVRLADDHKYDPRLVLTQIFTHSSEALSLPHDTSALDEMRKDAERMKSALEVIKGIVCGEALPNWDHTPRTYATRGKIADICDSAMKGTE